MIVEQHSKWRAICSRVYILLTDAVETIFKTSWLRVKYKVMLQLLLQLHLHQILIHLTAFAVLLYKRSKHATICCS